MCQITVHRDKGHLQNAVPEYESFKFETGAGVEAEVKDSMVDKTRPRSPIPTADHVENEANGVGVKTEVVDWIQTAPRHQKHTRRRESAISQELCSAVYDGSKVGDEVKAEAHDARRDNTKVDQLAGTYGNSGSRTPEVRRHNRRSDRGETPGASQARK